MGRSRRRAPPVRGRVVRRRHVIDRRDVRAPPPGRRRRAGARLPARRHDRPAELDAGRHDRRAVPDDGAVRPAAAARRPAAAAVGQRGAPERAVRRPRRLRHAGADLLEITAFEHPRDYGEHFKAHYGPTIVAQANARKTEREAEFDEGLNQFCDEWNRGTPDSALRAGVPAPTRYRFSRRSSSRPNALSTAWVMRCWKMATSVSVASGRRRSSASWTAGHSSSGWPARSNGFHTPLRKSLTKVSPTLSAWRKRSRSRRGRWRAARRGRRRPRRPAAASGSGPRSGRRRAGPTASRRGPGPRGRRHARSAR